MKQKFGMQENDSPDLTPPAAPQEARPRSSLAVLWNALSWLRDLAFSVLIAVVSIVFIYQPVKVEGTSMTPGLDDQERIFINKFTYRFGLGNIERGDTVVFRAPMDENKSYIKRVIGLPGDRVRIERGPREPAARGARTFAGGRQRGINCRIRGPVPRLPHGAFCAARDRLFDGRAWARDSGRAREVGVSAARLLI